MNQAAAKMTCRWIIRVLFLFHPLLGYNLALPSWGEESWSATFNAFTKEECRPASGSSPFGFLDLPQEFQKCKDQLEEAGQKSHPLIGKKTQEIIEFYGYPCKMHKVTTKDGYIITLHRIKSKGTSVLLWHGLGGSSDNWVFNGPTQSLAFVLADLGYDVWLGNSRGSTYSIGHEKLSSDDLEYWDFSWHENGIYDLPASIKHIMKKNGNNSIFYVGHSQGTTNFMVGASTKPGSRVVNEENILGAFLLAPAGFLGRNGGNSNRLLAPILINPTTGNLVRTVFGGRITSKSKLEELSGIYLGKVCSPMAIMCGVCTVLVLALSGFNAPLANYSNIPHLLDKYPNNIPLKSAIHYGQSISHCTFRQFDYGKKENEERYGHETPPDYELNKINVPTYIFWGPNDYTCAPEDVNRTKNAFRKKAVKGFIRVDHDSFGHSDFVIAKNVKELLYDGMIEEMEKLKPKK